MLGYQMLRRPYYTAAREMERFESFAYIMAAQFAGQEIPARMTESYKRAFDFDDWYFYSPVSLGRPGYCVVQYLGDFRRKVVVAIQGMTSWAQLLPIRSGHTPSTVAKHPSGNFMGQVFGPFAEYANTIMAELEALEWFMVMVQQNGTPVTYTGFSLGAAVAEVLRAKMAAKYPQSDCRLVKFGSPNVGTPQWQRNAEVFAGRDSVYVENDPIWLFPAHSPRFPTGQNWFPWCVYEFDSSANFIDLDGSTSFKPSPSPAEIFRATALSPSSEPTRENPWWHHRWLTYRHALTGAAHQWFEPGWDRFRYLELTPIENRWGADWRSRMNDWAELVAISDPPPADFNRPPPPQEWYVEGEVRYHEALATAGVTEDFEIPEEAFWPLANNGDLSPNNTPSTPVLPPVIRIMRTTRARRPIVITP